MNENQFNNCIHAWTSVMNNPHLCWIEEFVRFILSFDLFTNYFANLEIVIAVLCLLFSDSFEVFISYALWSRGISTMIGIFLWETVNPSSKFSAWISTWQTHEYFIAIKTLLTYHFFYFRHNSFFASFTTFVHSAPDVLSHPSCHRCFCSTQSFSLFSSWTFTFKTFRRKSRWRRKKSIEKFCNWFSAHV